MCFASLSVKVSTFSHTDTIAWLQGISHIYINSTVESRIPVHVAWYFRYYQVGKVKMGGRNNVMG